MRCRICESDVRRLKPTVAGSNGPMATYTCPNCGHLQTAMHLPTAAIEAQYSDSNYRQAYAEETGIEALDARAAAHAHFFRQAVQRYCDRSGPIGICDVGTGEGWLLRALSPDFDLYGVELCRESARIAEKTTGIGRVRHSLLEFDQSFDVLTFFDVLEHLAEPCRVVRLAVDKLHAGGLFVCINPGRNLWDDLAVAKYNPYPEAFLRRRLSMAHVSVFSAASLRVLLERSGLIVHEIKRFTDIGNSFAVAGGWRGRMIRTAVCTLASVGLAPRNRLMAIASKASR